MFQFRFFLFGFLFLDCTQSHAQQLQEDNAAIYWQQLTGAGSAERLFVHLDKSVYTNNEQIWFSAYFLNRSFPEKRQHQFISVSLISPQTKKVYLESKFIAGEGFSFGNIAIPDTIPPGNYLFTAFGNLVDAQQQPAAVYQQLITIKSVIKNNFRAYILPLDSLSTKEKFYVQVKAENLSYLPLKKAEVIYTTDGSKNETTYTNSDGLLTIAVPKKEGKGVLQIRVNYENEFQFLSAIIPARTIDTSLVVQFYPESGQLITGVTNRVLMRVQTADGNPVSTKAVLYRNKEAEDTLIVNTSGLCSFSFIPFETDEMQVQLMEPHSTHSRHFAAPKPTADAVVITTDNAVVTDTLRFQISAALPKEALLLVYTQDRLLLSNRIALSRQRKKFVLPFKEAEMPEGICTVAMIDTAGNLLAERLFFLKSQGVSPLSLQTDKPTYTRHEKVKLKIRFNDAVMKDDIIASVAVVQANRLLTINQPDIEQFNWMTNGHHQPPPFYGRAIDNKKHLEQLLMMGSGRERKQKLTPAPDSLSALQVRAMLSIDNRKPKTPQELLLFIDTSFAVITTDSSGVIVLTPELITTEQGKRILLALNKSADKLFSIDMSRQFIEIANGLAQQHSFEHPVMARNNIREEEPKEEIPGIKRLKEVVVVAKSNTQIYGTGPGGMGANLCGDYVCIYTILNCPNHFNDPLNKAPKDGEMVYTSTSRVTKVRYNGCTNLRNGNINRNAIKIPGIYMAKEFFGVEQEQKDMAEPEYRSTIFWRPGLLLKPGVTTELTFLTGDITGPFKIIVQGVANDGSVYYKEAKFTVVY